MATQRTLTSKITIETENTVDVVHGIILFRCHELDGSQTILIRTEALRKDAYLRGDIIPPDGLPLSIEKQNEGNSNE